MDVTAAGVLGSLLTLAVGYGLYWALKRRRDQLFFKRLGLPGPPPDLLYGNWAQLKKDRLAVMDRWLRDYGNTFGYFMAEIPCIVVADVEMIKQCFTKQSHVFRDRTPPLIDVDFLRKSLIVLTGDEWKNVRSVLNPTFSAFKLKMIQPVMDDCSGVMLRILDERVAERDVVDVFHLSRCLSMDIIAKCVLAWQVDCQKNPDDPLLRSVLKLFEDGEDVLVGSALGFPVLRTVLQWLIPLSGFAKAATKITDNVRHILKLRRSGEIPRIQDMLQLMMDAQEGMDGHDGERRGTGGKLIEDSHLLANCFLFLVAGTETTATAMAFVLYELARNPMEQERLYDELVTKCPGKSVLSYDDLRELKRLDMVISECLRMYPPVVFFTTRICLEETTVMGQVFPAGVTVHVPVWNVHHDPHLWSDPFKFDPERFAEGREGTRSAAYMPFGVGPRNCIGRRFALVELKTAVCKIVLNYEIQICDETQDPIKIVVPSIVINPEQGIKLKFVPRAQERR